MEKENKKQKIKSSILVAVFMLIAFIGGYFVHYAVSGETTRTINEIIDLMNEHSVSFDGVLSADQVSDGLVKGVLSNDDYADYFSKNEYQELMQQASGYYRGIGIELYSNEPKIFSINFNSPAYKAGLKKGDKIKSIKLTTSSTYTNITTTNEIVEFIGSLSVGQSINIKIDRNGTELDIAVIISDYVASYVMYYDSDTEYSFVSYDEKTLTGKRNAVNKMSSLPSDTAYIKLALFRGKAGYEFSEAMKFMKSQNRTKLILDLRDNLGGYMSILTEIASYLVDNGTSDDILIAVAKDKEGQEIFTTSERNFNSSITNIVVLANEYTASASECLIGAMTHYGSGNFDNSKLLLTKNYSRNDYSTFGKGIMQTTYRLTNGGALKLTTAHIYWPDNTTCIHNQGVKQLNTALQVTDESAINRAIEILS